MIRMITKQHKVFNIIIRRILINMMNNLSRLQISTKVFFHHKSVFSNIPIRITKGVCRKINHYISSTLKSAALPFPRLFSSNNLVTAFHGTKSSSALSRLLNIEFLRATLANNSSFYFDFPIVNSARIGTKCFRPNARWDKLKHISAPLAFCRNFFAKSFLVPICKSSKFISHIALQIKKALFSELAKIREYIFHLLSAKSLKRSFSLPLTLIILMGSLVFVKSSFAATISMPQYSPTSTLTNTNLNNRWNLIVNQMNGGLDGNNVKAGFRFIEILASTPAAGNQGRVVFDTSNNTLNFDTGASFLATALLSATQTFSGNNTFSGSTIFSGNTTFAGTTIADLGTVTTANIDGGTLDGVQIGGTTETGELIVNNATDDADGLGAQGTTGQVLMSAGTGVNPTFETLFKASHFEPDSTVVYAMDNGYLLKDLSVHRNVITPTSLDFNQHSDGKVSRKCYDYDGAADYLDITDNALANMAAAGAKYSTEVWVYRDTAGNEDTIYWDANSKVSMIMSDTQVSVNWDTDVGSSTVAESHGLSSNGINQWTYIVTVYDAADIYVYINGVQVGTEDARTGTLAALGNMRIGANPTPAGYFHGKIDGFRYMTRAMSSTEIADKYNAFK